MIYLVLLIQLLFGFQDPKTAVITNDQLQKMVDGGGITILDVRTPEEWEKGYIKDAVLIDIYDPDFLSKATALDKEKPMVIYCAAGGRSATATTKLLKEGFLEIYDLGGGFRGWIAEKRPSVK